MLLMHSLLHLFSESNHLINEISEIILATSATVEGDITAQFIADLANRFEIRCSRLARGIPLGGELEFVDSGTLSRALSGRQQVE